MHRRVPATTVKELRALLKGYPSEMKFRIGSPFDDRKSFQLKRASVKRVRQSDGMVSARADTDVLVLDPG